MIENTCFIRCGITAEFHDQYDDPTEFKLPKVKGFLLRKKNTAWAAHNFKTIKMLQITLNRRESSSD